MILQANYIISSANLQMRSLGESLSTVGKVAEVALLATNHSRNTVGASARLKRLSSWTPPGLRRHYGHLLIRQEEEELGVRDWDKSSRHSSVAPFRLRCSCIWRR